MLTLISYMLSFKFICRGGVELVCIDGSAVHVKLRGACSNCPRSFVTLQSGVLKKLQERIEGIERIVQIVDEI
jgi:Fe-S cluster biogenesis protein NfuA